MVYIDYFESFVVSQMASNGRMPDSFITSVTLNEDEIMIEVSIGRLGRYHRYE